jgi:hypothetical protein
MTVRVLRELRDPGPFTTGATYCLALAGGRHFRVQTLICAEYPDIKQTLIFPADARGWPLDWGRFLCLNGMDREQALAELERRVGAARARGAEHRPARNAS